MGGPGQGDHDVGGHDPQGLHGHTAQEPAQRIDSRHQGSGPQPVVRTTLVGVDGDPAPEERRSVVVGRGGHLPSLEPEVLGHGVTLVGALGGVGPGHGGVPAGERSTGETRTLTMVVNRRSAPSSISSTATAPPEDGWWPSSRRDRVTIGPIRPRAR